MKFIEITDLKSANDLRQLYIESFIPAERIEFDQLFSGVFKDFRMVCLYNDFGSLVGMMHYIVKENFIHLNYFAISPKFRGQGFGSMCLSWLKETYDNKPIVVDIEEEDEHADNNDYVRLRKKFYGKNGLTLGEYTFYWNGVFMTYMHTGTINSDEFMKHITHIFPTIINIQKR